jgi:hypothetical protein
MEAEPREDLRQAARLAEERRLKRHRRIRWVISLAVFLLLITVYGVLPRGADRVYEKFPDRCPADLPCVRSTFLKPHPVWPPLVLYTDGSGVRRRIARALNRVPRLSLRFVSADKKLIQLVRRSPGLGLAHDLVIRLVPRGDKTGLEFFAAARVGWMGDRELREAMKQLRTALTVPSG